MPAEFKPPWLGAGPGGAGQQGEVGQPVGTDRQHPSHPVLHQGWFRARGWQRQGRRHRWPGVAGGPLPGARQGFLTMIVPIIWG